LKKKQKRELHWLLPLTETLKSEREKNFSSSRVRKKKKKKKSRCFQNFRPGTKIKISFFLHDQLWLCLSREKIERENVCVIFASGFGARSRRRRRRRRRRNEGGVVEEERVLFRDAASASNRREKIIILVATTEEREE
tara:strand:- start:82 stop:495 length:414 start_codon:yes stop_codon:yes gene_type:complete